MAPSIGDLVAAIDASGPGMVRTAARLMTRLEDEPQRLPELFRAVAELDACKEAPLDRLRSNQHGIPHGGKRRGIAQVEHGQLIGVHAGVQRGGDNIDALRHSFGARHLAAQQPPAVPLGQQLHADVAATEVTGPAQVVHNRGNEPVARRMRFGFR